MGWSDVFLFTNQFLNANKPFVKFRSRIRGHPWIWIEPNIICGWVWSKYKWAKVRDFWIFNFYQLESICSTNTTAFYTHILIPVHMSARFISYDALKQSQVHNFSWIAPINSKTNGKNFTVKWTPNKNFSRLISLWCWNFDRIYSGETLSSQR